MYLSSVEGTNKRESPLGRWEDRLREYVNERGVRVNGLEWTGKGGDLSARAKPLGDTYGGSKASELMID